MTDSSVLLRVLVSCMKSARWMERALVQRKAVGEGITGQKT